VGLLGEPNAYGYPADPVYWADPLGLGRKPPAWVRRLPAGMTPQQAGNTTLRQAMTDAGRPGGTINQIGSDLLDMSVRDVSRMAGGDTPDDALTAMKLLKQDKSEKNRNGCRRG